MDVEAVREMLLQLPHVVETMQWGDNLVFWVGDKAIGGKMFALADLKGEGGVLAFAAGPERFAELVEMEGFRPAPYLARAYWVIAERWDVLTARSWQAELAASHALVFGRLARHTRAVLALSPREQAKAVAAARRAATEKKAAAARR